MVSLCVPEVVGFRLLGGGRERSSRKAQHQVNNRDQSEFTCWLSALNLLEEPMPVYETREGSHTYIVTIIESAVKVGDGEF